MSKLRYCKLCGGNQKEYYVYHRVIKDGYEIVFCNECADRITYRICYICGECIGGGQINYYTVTKKRTLVGDVCERCVCTPNFREMIEKPYTPPPSFEIGIYCGFCFIKKAIYLSTTITSVQPIKGASYIYNYSIKTKSCFRKYKNRSFFTRINKSHKWSKCKEKMCKIKKCGNSGWSERFGYCREHMHDEEFRYKIINVISDATNLCKDISEIIFECAL